MGAKSDSSDREMVITRVIDAPRELVWRAWTEVEHVAKWWGPSGFTNTFQTFEVRVGGEWKFVMHGPDGRDYKNRIKFLEIAKPERLVYEHGGGDTEPVDFYVTVTFEDQAGKTKVTMVALFDTVEKRDQVIRDYGAMEGGKQHLTRLAEHVKAM